MATHIKFQIEDNTAYITFFEESERKPCTLDWDVLSELNECISKISQAEPAYTAVVLQSASLKSFIVGANIAVLKTLNADNIAGWVENGHRIFNRLQKLTIPVIAKVEHFALGGGLELAMACDMIIASGQAQFGQPEASLGVMPGWGGSYRLQMLIGPNRAKELFMTGKIISAHTAYDWGLVNYVCPNEEIDGYVKDMIGQIAKNDARVLGYIKKIINEETQSAIYQNGFLEATTSSVCMSSSTTIERLNHFFESRKK